MRSGGSNSYNMISVKVNQYVRCNTVGGPSAGHEGVLEWILDSPEDVLRGWGPDYGMVDGVPCNLHHCVAVAAPTLPAPPQLTVDLLKEGRVSEYHYTSTDVILLLEEAGYTHLGWVNGGLQVPALDDWMEVYRNRSGSYTIMVSHGSMLIYCVDMGD